MPAKKPLLLLVFLIFSSFIFSQAVQTVDICVYGGTAGGVMAAYTAKKLGKSVVLVEPGSHTGGLTTGGLGYTDIGNKYAISGLSRDFYRRIGKHYGKFEQWIFEPSVAQATLDAYIKAAGLSVLYRYRLAGVRKKGDKIGEIIVEQTDHPAAPKNRTIRASMFIDCSYEGDLMARAGVSYFVGREANSVYNETYNGVQVREKHQFPDGIDPYKIPGDPNSGLLWGISNGTLDAPGSGDKKVQTYNFRICLTKDPSNKIDIGRPAGYDSTRYELLLRYLEKKPATDLWAFLKFDLMPNNKTDINNNGPFSTDMIGMNYNYPEGDYATRKKIIQAHEEYTKGFLYFIGHDPRMPIHLRELMLQWGYPKDEYADNGNWTPQLYVREARRMVGAYVMTQANCEGRQVVDDGVGMAAYTMDSHNTQRVVANGMVKNEGDVQIGGFGPYPISYRSLIPKAGECSNLLVPVCLSASHIAYGSIRMEPVFMVLSQSAATAAVQAIDRKVPVQSVDVKALQTAIRNNPLADGSTPEILVDNDDRAHVQVSGEWKTEKTGSYGPSLFSADGKDGGIKTVKFTPDIRQAGRYHIYAYFPKLKNASSQTTLTVSDGHTAKEIVISEKDVRVEGQTAGEWVSLGTLLLPKGQASAVTISTKNADGLVAADAILFVPE
ncbi:MAG: FAD-dependent oxidoreductase [Williamsia sp.]|nr:FAD-dependent oxidoreductase [Williamsia sp.]